MADEEDLAALRAGSKDLVRRDFRSADLAGQELKERDFTGAHLEGARLSHSNLSGSDLRDASLANLNLAQANLTNTKFSGAVFRVDFSGADLGNADMRRCLFNGCNFKNADLRGADFRSSQILEDSSFEGAITDATTLFDDAQILRAIARQHAFRRYRVERGVLTRISETDEPKNAEFSTIDRAKLIEQIDSLLADLRRLEQLQPYEKIAPGMGHNGPPSETPIDYAEHSALARSLNEIKTEVSSENPNKFKLKESEKTLVKSGAKIQDWLLKRGEIFADEFIKGLAKNLSDPLRLSAAWTLFTGNLSEFVHLLRTLLGS